MGEYGFGGEIYSLVNTFISIILGGGWFLHWRASRRKASGEATQSEAEGWKGMQELYQKTIADFDGYCEDMRKERSVLKTENNEMREKYKKMDDEILVLKRQISRQGRKIDSLSPFLCGVAGCMHRKKVSMVENIDDNSFSTSDENENLEPQKD